MQGDLLSRFADLWVGCLARPRRDALRLVEKLTPATLVTGASEGFGFALARVLAKENRTVVMVARSRSLLLSSVSALAEENPEATLISLPLDIGERDAAEKIDLCLAAHGLYLDVLVNNAGVGVGGRFTDLESERIEELTATNMLAATRLMRHYLPAMRARGRGGVLNLASLAAFAPGPWQALYFASKAYLLSLTTAVGHECWGEGVRICALASGPFESRLHDKMGASATLYRALLPSFAADKMARAAWRGYRLGMRVVIPGWTNKILAACMSVLPRDVIVPIVGVLMKPRHWGLRSYVRQRKATQRLKERHD